MKTMKIRTNNLLITSILFIMLVGCKKAETQLPKQESTSQNKIELRVLDAILNDSIVHSSIEDFDNTYVIMDKNDFLGMDSMELVRFKNHNLQIIPKFSKDVFINVSGEKLKNHKYEILIEIYNKYGGHQFFEAKVVEDHGKIKILEIWHYEI